MGFNTLKPNQLRMWVIFNIRSVPMAVQLELGQEFWMIFSVYLHCLTYYISCKTSKLDHQITSKKQSGITEHVEKLVPPIIKIRMNRTSENAIATNRGVLNGKFNWQPEDSNPRLSSWHSVSLPAWTLPFKVSDLGRIRTRAWAQTSDSYRLWFALCYVKLGVDDQFRKTISMV